MPCHATSRSFLVVQRMLGKMWKGKGTGNQSRWCSFFSQSGRFLFRPLLWLQHVVCRFVAVVPRCMPDAPRPSYKFWKVCE